MRGAGVANECKACKGRTELVVCWKCAKKLRRLLVGQDDQPGLDWYADRLTEQAYGQAKMGRPQRQSGDRPAPLPFDGRSSDLLAEITAATSAWASARFGTSGRTQFSPAVYCQALARDPGELMKLDEAPQMLQDAERFSARARAAINRPPDIYCGPCPATLENGKVCGTELRADEGERFVQCRRCRAMYDVEGIRDRLLAHVDDEPKTAADLLRLFRWLGVDVKRSTFYHRVGRIPPRMFLHKDGSRNMRRLAGSTALYAYSDVRALMAGDGGAQDDGPASATQRKRTRARRQRVAS
ncbi:hypothetical protein I5G67_gp074 [Mycobacterium phage Aminay]|uniref:Helix-turn-helix DNA binding domain protein n=1 Tax=Mycobacterium phage Aminay TaxID=2250291 RepID=A0A345KV58_9CAUD|nr:hypothetical protein I5G67_gp074 [Mycobacterium phage Aminay]AXH46910.1 hypothetical protein SEA_AMINAY_74 [Mycobacterium phage Aminay]